MWPFRKKEHVETRSAGGYTEAIVAAIEAHVGGTAADVSSTAALEAASGALSRAFSGARVSGPSWAQDAVTPIWLGQVGRSLIRDGASMSVIVPVDGRVDLIPSSHWNFENLNPGNPEGEREDTWQCRVTTYGPSTTRTRVVGRDRLVFVRWGTSPGTRYRGQGPTSWAATTAKLQGNIERNLSYESGMPVGTLFPIPAGHGPDQDADAEDGALTSEVEALEAKIRTSKGTVRLVETVAGGWEESGNRPQGDWDPKHYGASPDPAAVELGSHAFKRMLAACGCSPAMFDDSPGTAKREAQRQFYLGTVHPLAVILEYELNLRGLPVKLHFDLYNVDLAGRAQAFKGLVSQGVEIDKALALTGLLMNDD